jgi:glycosyltransferase involved in cell wall biosynthesis
MRTFQEQTAISVVIPTLDAAATLPETLAALADAAVVREIIVSDGGSRDDTIAVARRAGVRIVTAPRGRGTQLAAGAAAASGEWLLFLHADCRLAPGWQSAVETFIAGPEAAVRAGYFAFALDDETPAARLVPLDASLRVSARRYKAGGYIRRPLRNLLCLSLYFAGVPPRRIARLYG